jgi:hypothetical protein
MKREIVNSAGEIEKAGCVITDGKGRFLLVKNTANHQVNDTNG